MTHSDQSLETVALPVPGRDAGISFSGLVETCRSQLANAFTPKISTMPNPLTHETFREFVTGHPFAMVHFWAPWSEGDRLMNQFLAAHASDRWHQQVTTASFNIDLPEHLELARQHKVFDLPFLAFYRNGQLTRTITGLHTPAVVTRYLRELISPPDSR